MANIDLHYEWHEELREIFANVAIQPKGALPCRIVPYPRNPRFSGREAILQELRAHLAISKSGQKSYALHGLGGVGKTQIALKYIHDHMEEFPAVFWMNADSYAKLSQSYINAAKQLQIEPQDSQRDAEAVSTVLKQWLAEANTDWLIVFDNADDLDILKPFWPPAGHGTILITSRNPASARIADHGTLVKPLDPMEGKELFVSLLTIPEEEKSDESMDTLVEEIVKQLGKFILLFDYKVTLTHVGFLPLAINQVAHFVMERGCSLEEFNEIYKDILKSSDEVFSKLETSTTNFYYSHSLATVWRISITNLPPDSTSLLAILACFDPDGIPESLLRHGSKGNPELSFLAETAKYFDTINSLIRAGLIVKNNTQVTTTGKAQDEKPVKSISIHRLVQETVFHHQDAETQNATFLKALILLQKTFPSSTRTNWRLMHRWAECELYLPHVLALESRCNDSPSLNLPPQLAELFFHASWYLYERRLPELALPLLRTARKVYEIYNNDPFLKSRIFAALGIVCLETGNVKESLLFFKDVIDIRTTHMPDDVLLLAYAYGDMAYALAAVSRFDECFDLYKKALDIVEDCNDDFTRRDMLFHFHHNMGRAYEKLGNPQEALRHYFHQGDVQGNGLRIEKSNSGTVNLYAVGNAYLALGDPCGVDYHTRALKLRKELVGDHYFTAISLHKMGCILYDSGSYAEADEAFEQALSIFQASYEARGEMSRTMYHWSLVKRELNKGSQAIDLLDRAWKLRTGLTGVSRNDTETGSKGFDDLVFYAHA